jgi:hypothetical protein
VRTSDQACEEVAEAQLLQQLPGGVPVHGCHQSTRHSRLAHQLHDKKIANAKAQVWGKGKAGDEEATEAPYELKDTSPELRCQSHCWKALQ